MAVATQCSLADKIRRKNKREYANTGGNWAVGPVRWTAKSRNGVTWISHYAMYRLYMCQPLAYSLWLMKLFFTCFVIFTWAPTLHISQLLSFCLCFFSIILFACFIFLLKKNIILVKIWISKNIGLNKIWLNY